MLKGGLLKPVLFIIIFATCFESVINKLLKCPTRQMFFNHLMHSFILSLHLSPKLSLLQKHNFI